MAKTKMQEHTSYITNMVNSFSFNFKEFCQTMQYEHRTLQQSFTRLCLAWIQHCASDAYPTDGRNEASHIVCARLLEAAKAGGMDVEDLDRLPMV